jgi:heat shock protein HspQ
MEQLEDQYEQACSTHRNALDKHETLQLQVVRAQRQLDQAKRQLDKAFKAKEALYAKLNDSTNASRPMTTTRLESITPKYRLGQRIEKEFDGVPYQAEIVGLPEPDFPWYHVLYEDGDEEHLGSGAMDDFIIENGSDEEEEEGPSTPRWKLLKAAMAVVTPPVNYTAANNEKRQSVDSMVDVPTKRLKFTPQGGHPEWVEEMEYFLEQIPHGRFLKTCSSQNTKSVIHQVRKLTSGVGITYKNWPEGVAFLANQHLSLEETDFDALLKLARKFEKQHGKDKRNGWLIQHPIKKMRMFKEYRDNAGHAAI